MLHKLYNRAMHLHGSGKTVVVLVILLVVLGLAALSSAGVVEGQKKFGSPYYFLKHQLIYGVLPGLLLFWMLSKINYKIWKKLALPLLLLTAGLMVLVFVPGFGVAVKGAQRWLNFGSFTFQPSEFLKLAVIMYLAAWFSGRDNRSMAHWAYSVVPFLLVLTFVGFLLILQPDIKTLVLITLISAAVYFFAGAKISHILILFVILVLIVIFLSFVEPYRWNRVKAFFNPAIDRQGVSYHINQALLGIGSGGVFGLGYGQSKQKINYLPEPIGDSIFAILVEEMGFVGGLLVLSLFVFLVLTMVKIAKNVSDQFGRLLVLGVAVWLAAQTFINVGAILGLIPLTGVPLPFFSYGSSSLVALCIALGMAVSVSRHV